MDLLGGRLVLLIQLVIVGIKVLFGPASGMPSTRVVYYLHTRSATWNEASATCSSYGAVLLTVPEVQSTSSRLHYVDKTVWGVGANGALSSLTQGFWAGLYRNSTKNLRWQKCTEYYDNAKLPVHSLPGGFLLAPSCYVSNSNLELSALNCEVKRPYICQRDDGQCWFQPFMDISIQDSDNNNSHTVTIPDTADETECAKHCRSKVDQGRECWAFSFGEPTAVCRLHFSEKSHKYALSSLEAPATTYFHSHAGVTAYVKICTGGWMTSLAASTTDTSPLAKDENCTVITPDAWDNSVCYCECDQPPIILEAETLVMTIEEKVDKIVKELEVDPQNTSSTRRKKNSAEDSRPSAQGIGYVGVGCLVVVFGSIFLMDLNVFLIHAAKLCGKGGNDNSSGGGSGSDSKGKGNKEHSDA